MWLRKILLCSTATFSGGYYICYWSKSKTINCCKKHNKNSYIYPSEDNVLPEMDFDEPVVSTWAFWKKSSVPTYWRLLMLCKSKDYKVRHKAVESLSQLENLEKWQYIVVAQACDVNTAVGLARSSNVNPHFFLPPPFKDLDTDNLQKELYLMLSSFEFSNLDICTQNLIRKVIKSAETLLKNGYSVDLEVGDPFVLYHSQQKKKAVYFYDKLCLETILACSTKSCHRNLLIKKQILKLLLKILESHKNDIEIQSLIAQILANLAMDEKFRNSIYMTGWIGILSEWKKSPYISINLPAAKALANMDNDDLFHPLYDDGVYLLSPICRISQKNLTADVIFIHGLLGGTFWTWRQCDTQKKPKVEINAQAGEMSTATSSKQYSMCWPKEWLANDIPSLRIISVDYKTSLSNWKSYCPQLNERNYIQKRATEIMDKLLLSNVGERPIIWIAHSMGGLIIKQILVESFKSKEEKIQSFIKNTTGIVFYSVPHKGSQLANKIKSASVILQPSSSIAELQEGSATLLSLHENFKDIISKNDISILSFGETKKSCWGVTLSVLVPLDSADPGFGEFYTLPVDHLSTCKPVSSKSLEYLKVLNFLKENLSKISANEMHSLQTSDKIFEIAKMMCLIP